MKLHTIVFVDSRGYAEPRTIQGIGRVSILTVGQEVNDGASGPAVVASLECDTRSGVLVVRKKAKEGGDPVAARLWANGTGESQRREADFCVIDIGSATCYGNDADQPQKQQPQKPAQVEDATQDPPPAKPIPSQPKGK